VDNADLIERLEDDLMVLISQMEKVLPPRIILFLLDRQTEREKLRLKAMSDSG